MAPSGTIGLKRPGRVTEICSKCRHQLQESALEVAPLVPYIDEKIHKSFHDRLLPGIVPWTLDETLNVPYCTDGPANEDDEDDDLPTDCSVCAPYLRHCGAAFAGFSDVQSYGTYLAYQREETAKKQPKVPVIIVDDNEYAEAMNRAVEVESEPRLDVCAPVIPNQGLVDHMKVVSELQSVRGRRVINSTLHTDPAAIGCLQGVVAAFEQMEASAKTSVEVAEARILQLQEALRCEERELNELRVALDSVEAARPRKVPHTLASNTASKSTSTVAVTATVPTFLQVLTSNPPVTTQTQSQLKQFRKLLASAQTPSYDDPPEVYAKWLQFHENQLVKGVPVHGPDWVVDLRDVRGRNAVLSRVPQGMTGTREQRRHFADCLLAVLRVLCIPGAYTNILERTGIAVAGEVVLSSRFPPPGPQFSPPTEDGVVQSLAGQGLTVETANDAWQFCYKFLEAHTTAHESIFGPDVAKNLLERVNEKFMNSQKLRKWCPECPRFAISAQETSPLESEMEKVLETELLKTLKDGPATWRVDSRAGIGIPICGSKCNVCRAFVSHVAKSRGRRRVEEEEQDGDHSSEEDEDDSDSDDSGSDEEEDEDEDDDLVEREDLVEDEDLVEHMKNLFKLQCMNGRIRTNHLFQTDRAALGRAQKNIAALQKSNSLLDEKRVQLQAEVAQLEQKLRDIQADSTRLRSDLEQLDPNASRKRSIVLSDGLVDDLATESSGVASLEEIAKLVRSHRRSISGVQANGPDRTVDLRDVRGYVALRSLIGSGSHSRYKSSRDLYRRRFFAVLSVIAIPGLYTERIHYLSVPIATVELSSCTFGSQLDQDTVVRRLAETGLTKELADDCWQYCYKFMEAEVSNVASVYDKNQLIHLRGRADAVIAARGKPPGLRSESEDRFPSLKLEVCNYSASSTITLPARVYELDGVGESDDGASSARFCASSKEPQLPPSSTITLPARVYELDGVPPRNSRNYSPSSTITLPARVYELDGFFVGSLLSLSKHSQLPTVLDHHLASPVYGLDAVIESDVGPSSARFCDLYEVSHRPQALQVPTYASVSRLVIRRLRRTRSVAFPRLPVDLVIRLNVKNSTTVTPPSYLDYTAYWSDVLYPARISAVACAGWRVVGWMSGREEEEYGGEGERGVREQAILRVFVERSSSQAIMALVGDRERRGTIDIDHGSGDDGRGRWPVVSATAVIPFVRVLMALCRLLHRVYLLDADTIDLARLIVHLITNFNLEVVHGPPLLASGAIVHDRPWASMRLRGPEMGPYLLLPSMRCFARRSLDFIGVLSLPAPLRDASRPLRRTRRPARCTKEIDLDDFGPLVQAQCTSKTVSLRQCGIQDEGPKYSDRNGRPITPVYDSAGRAVYPVGRIPFNPNTSQMRACLGRLREANARFRSSAYSEQRPGAKLAEEATRPLPGRPISPGRYSPRPAVTPFPIDLAQADVERERLERLAEVGIRLQGAAEDAQEAEYQWEREFRKDEEDRERIFMESEQRREQEATERQDAIWKDTEDLGWSYIHSVEATTDAASLLASSIKDTVLAEREEFAREPEEMAAARARLEAERDAARDVLLGEKEARVKALEEELATLRGEIDNERQLRSTENVEAQEWERQVLTDTSEMRAQLGDITNLIQKQRAACERKKYREGHRGIHTQNAEQRELLVPYLTRADCTRQHEETIAAVRSTAQEQVHFNVQGYLDDFSKALAFQVRMLLGEVRKLREERCSLQHELGYLLCVKAKYSPGGEFEPDCKPPPGAPGGPPLDLQAPAPPDLSEGRTVDFNVRNDYVTPWQHRILRRADHYMKGNTTRIEGRVVHEYHPHSDP
ncbi:hypothetical protein B0H11DRAFT_1898262 [Mycena galericulata]|nr:hypothetical protein B0H11DRAFT_1898262 [Mycena galericulata]